MFFSANRPLPTHPLSTFLVISQKWDDQVKNNDFCIMWPDCSPKTVFEFMVLLIFKSPAGYPVSLL